VKQVLAWSEIVQVENIFITLVSMALIIVSTVTMTVSSFQSANKIAQTWKSMEQKAVIIRQTEITITPPEDYRGGNIELEVRNAGQINLSDYTSWDVIVQYQSGNSSYLVYTPDFSPANNQWTVDSVYLSRTVPEVFDKGILNPGELMIISLKLDPEISAGEALKITVSTPGGVTSQCQLMRETIPSP
jgi:hypothetical protein